MGKMIEEMTREELLEFAAWAMREIYELQKIERETEDYRLEQELNRTFPPRDMSFLGILKRGFRS